MALKLPVVDYEDQGLVSESGAVPVQYYTTGMDVRSITGRIADKEILIPWFEPESSDSLMPGFQRDFVWTSSDQDSFVESLLLGYPVPSVFLVRQADKKLLVLDGQQRLTTIKTFADGKRANNQNFVLGKAAGRFEGLSFQKLSPEDRRTFENTVIQSIVIDRPSFSEKAKQDSIDDSIFRIFERLNAGGVKLHPHEIRIALYNGPFVRLVRELSQTESWMRLVGSWAQTWRSSELITRHLAYLLAEGGYRSPMKRFLNEFVRDHRNEDGASEAFADAKRGFIAASDALDEALGESAFKLKGFPNAAVADAVLFGVAKRARFKRAINPTKLRARHKSLLASKSFVDAVEKATADKERVDRRLEQAQKAFAPI